MRRNWQRSVRLAISILGVLIVSPALLGQTAPAPEKAIPVPTDWSHRHVIFSRPATTEQARSIEKDPRYWQQRYRSELPRMAPEVKSAEAEIERTRRRGRRKLHRDWSESLGSGASVGADNFPATFSLLGNTASCASATQPDFAIYSSGLAGATNQASIVAYDNVYTGCIGTVPSVYWAYNTGGQVSTSPVYSLDGTQVAFVQTAGLEGSLVLLKWAASTSETVGSPSTLTSTTPALYATCTTPPCMTTFLLTNLLGTPADDTTSSAFYDYSGDAAYVGDSHGWLHKFSPVFNGTPAEIRTGGWPVQLNGGAFVDSPVFDSVSGNVFVGDGTGFLYRVNSSGVVTKSGKLDYGAGVVEGPTVNPTLGLVYVFASSDGTANCTAGAACAAVYQLSTSFAASNTGSEAVVGTSVVFGHLPNPNPLYGGDFDNAYRTSTNGTGSLYVCGNTGASPTIYQIAIHSGVMGTVSTGPALASGNPPCSPVTDVLNPNISAGASEWIFASAQTGGTSTACAAGGCIFNFKDTPWKASTVYSLGQEILDSNLHIEAVQTAGTSGLSAPFWSISTGSITTDNTVQWLDQGPATAVTPAPWASSHTYALDAEILDSNNNIERSGIAGGVSGGSPPTWSTIVGASTTDGTETWTNLGSIATVALPAAGGTSGIVIDNTVQALPGASQVYFSTLSNQTCATSGTIGGCAVQASQSGLQ